MRTRPSRIDAPVRAARSDVSVFNRTYRLPNFWVQPSVLHAAVGKPGLFGAGRQRQGRR
jgi:hypothetical protein